MRKESVSAVENVRDCVFLMLAEGDFGIHSPERDMLAAVFARSCGVKQLVVFADKCATAVGGLPYPLGKRVLYRLLFLSRESRFFGVEHSPLFSVGICDCIVDANIAQIQRIFQYLVCVRSVSTICVVSVDVSGIHVLAGYVPFRGELGVFKSDFSSQIERRVEKLKHELPHISLVDPSCAEPDFYLARVKVFRLCRTQCFHIHGIGRIKQSRLFRLTQFLAHIAG